MRILLVEDDDMIGESVVAGLECEGHAIDWVRDGNSALLALNTTPFSLVILDLGLPGKDGLQVLKEMRAKRNPTPVLVTTARDTVDDRILGLDSGADDYLVKPYDLDELCARIRALLRRSAGRADPIIERGELRISPATREVTYRGQPVILSSKEYALLAALAERQGVVWSRSSRRSSTTGTTPSAPTPSRSTSTICARSFRTARSRPCAAWATFSRPDRVRQLPTV